MQKIFLGVLLVRCFFYGRIYEVPPTTSYYMGNTDSVISDAKMKECVILYNRAKWLGEKIRNMNSNQSIDYYNSLVRQHNSMLQEYNLECAGKQSYSAWKATQELNQGR